MEDDDEHQPWHDITKHITPLRSAPRIPPAGDKRARRTPRRKPDVFSVAPVSGMPPQTLERTMYGRIAKSREPIEARLDLHGLTQTEAYERCCRFIHGAYGNNVRTVLIITGKGRGGEGALRRAFVHWLETEALRPYITGYHSAAQTHGGTGAWYVRLRKAPDRSTE